ncbi:MAG: DUF4416 family protein [Deltaproteobacteria bacterium]|nr:DUF4416 family protein [Deltaproteobacteria bacterium]
MSLPRSPQAVKLVMSFILAEEKAFASAISEADQQYGPVDFLTEPLPFDFTAYYEPEMGRGLRRRLAGFGPLTAPEQLPEIKLWTNALESKFLNEREGRKVNIDPGYLAASKFILATGKDYSHRVYLGQGIYGDLTLWFQKGVFTPLPWTYPDYASQPLIGLINLLRKRYLWQLKNPEAQDPRVQGAKNNSPGEAG